MKKMKRYLILAVMLVVCFCFVGDTAGAKSAKLKAPVMGQWKKTYDSARNKFKFDGVTYAITWKKVPKAKGYQVYFGTKEEGKWYITKKLTKKLNYSVNFSHIEMKLKIKVRAYKVVKGKKVFGPWSSLRTKKINY